MLLFERVEASCKTIRINADDDGWSSMDMCQLSNEFRIVGNLDIKSLARI